MANDGPKLWQNLLKATSSAVQLQIVTQVGDATISGEIASPKLEFEEQKGTAIATSINLIEGDITSVVPEKFWAPDQQIVRDFHEAQVEQAKDIVERNLRLIGELGERIFDAIIKAKQIED
ncbi:MAG: hypothetical protein R6X02_29380 [Enhygromyxa sp.]